jgi:adenine deaminase
MGENQMNCEWKLAGGLVVDGTGSKAYRADVAISSGRIQAVGDLLELEAGRTVDCSDRIVTPGFIDIHSHSDFLMPGTDASTLVETATPLARAADSSWTTKSSQGGKAWTATCRRSTRAECR